MKWKWDKDIQQLSLHCCIKCFWKLPFISVFVSLPSGHTIHRWTHVCRLHLEQHGCTGQCLLVRAAVHWHRFWGRWDLPLPEVGFLPPCSPLPPQITTGTWEKKKSLGPAHGLWLGHQIHWYTDLEWKLDMSRSRENTESFQYTMETVVRPTSNSNQDSRSCLGGVCGGRGLWARPFSRPVPCHLGGELLGLTSRFSWRINLLSILLRSSSLAGRLVLLEIKDH